MNNNENTNNKQRSTTQITSLRLYLLPVAGLILPLIIYIFTYSPILTQNMVDEITFARFLATNNSHSFTENWISTKEYIPVSIRFFMSFFASSDASWTTVLFLSVLCCYLLFSISFMFFFTSLRLKKVLSYSIAAVLAFICGYYCLIATYDCNYIITYLSYLLLICGFIILSIRSHFVIPIRIAIGSISLLIVFATIFSMKSLHHKYSFSVLKIATASSLFTSPLNPSKTLTDITPSIAGVSDYLQKNNIEKAYSTSDITNQIALLAGNSRTVTCITAINDLRQAITTDRILSSDDSYKSEETSPITMIVSSDDRSVYSVYLSFGHLVYEDDYYSIYNFDRYLYIDDAVFVSDDSIRSELISMDYFEFDTAILSMYDISTIDINRLYTAKLWTCYMPENIFSDTNYFDIYNERIFMHNPNRYILCIDPYMLYCNCDYDESAYKAFIDNSLSSIIAANPLVEFRFILPSYYVYHYIDYDENDYLSMRSSYEILLRNLEQYSNLNFNYFGYQEYLYSNASLYENNSYSAYVSDVADTLLLETLADDDHIMNADTVLAYLDIFIDEIKIYPYNSEQDYSISSTNIVILGDSIFGNYTDNTSIQRIVSYYSGANTVCMAVGGAHAAYLENRPEYSLNYQLNIDTINQKLSENGSLEDKTVFIIEFGINDYISGIPIDNPTDLYDITTYSGSLRSSVETIRESWPQCDIIFLIPGQLLYNEYGTVENSVGYNLDKYRKAAVSIADEYSCSYINLCNLEITQENCQQYIYGDLIHYNGRGRYIIAKYLLQYLSAIY